MRNIITILTLIVGLCTVQAQKVNLSGKVLDASTNQPLSSANVKVKDTNNGVFANSEGRFSLEVSKLPITLEVTILGYEGYSLQITKPSTSLIIKLFEQATSLDAVVIAASRTPERVFESPVSIERMGTQAVEQTTAATFYDGLENLKGVDVYSSSLTFKTINTRGFATFANNRFVQLVDGMDNSSPGLNFPLGNLIGLNELDVQSVELLPGASSALYGANAFNGILLMKSKSPFLNEGTSVYGKTGVTESGNAGMNSYYDVGFRYGRKINDKIAFKLTSSFLKATDWFATDDRNINDDGKVIDGDRDSDPNYNGINIYGDMVNTTLPGGIGEVSRTGYSEQELANNDTDNFKAALSLHFRPFEDDSELILSSNFGTGNTIYQGASRYALRNFVMHQHKIEFQNEHLMVRAYATIEDAGDSYDIRFAGINTLRAENAATRGSNTNNTVDELWFGTYANALQGNIGGVPPGNIVAARAAADATFRTDPNSQEFRDIFNRVINDPDLTTGAKFIDNSKLYHSDINYNFRDQIEFAELQLGASFRRYELDSEGTIYTDTDGPITYDEFGIYTQLQKKLMDDRLKLTGSIRYDKSNDFDGNFSPRFSVSYSLDEEKNHIVRASIQTGFRNPTTQDQYIGLNLGNTVLIGSASDNPGRYNKSFDITSAGGQGFVGGATTSFNGLQGYNNSYTRSSVEAFSEAVTATSAFLQTPAGGGFTEAQANSRAAVANSGLLQQADIDFVKPEQVTAYEVGYRGRLGNKTILDFSAYYNQYTDFISVVTTIAPLYGDIATFSQAEAANTDLINNSKALLNALGNNEFTPTSLYTNTDADISSYGVNLGVETKVLGNYNLGVSYSFVKQDFNQADDPDFETNFNTPEHRVKFSFDNPRVYKEFGFGVNLRWQDAFDWTSTFVDDTVSARTIVDAQVTFDVEELKSKLKVGGANILGSDYITAPGSGTVGRQLFVSWTSNFN